MTQGFIVRPMIGTLVGRHAYIVTTREAAILRFTRRGPMYVTMNSKQALPSCAALKL